MIFKRRNLHFPYIFKYHFKKNNLIQEYPDLENFQKKNKKKWPYRSIDLKSF